METNEVSAAQGWSASGACTLAVICLLLGTLCGYLFRGSAQPAPPSTVAAQSVSAPMTMPPSAATAPGAPAANPGQAQQVSPEQMKAATDRTVQVLLERLKQNPNDADLLSQLGNVYAVGHQFVPAEQYFERAAKIRPSARAYTDLAGAYHFGGSDEKSMQSLEHALRVEPNFPEALFNLGMLKLQVKGDSRGAIELWEKLLKTSPHDPHRADVEQAIAMAKQHPGTGAGKP